jgi:hypothetical protein
MCAGLVWALKTPSTPSHGGGPHQPVIPCAGEQGYISPLANLRGLDVISVTTFVHAYEDSLSQARCML